MSVWTDDTEQRAGRQNGLLLITVFTPNASTTTDDVKGAISPKRPPLLISGCLFFNRLVSSRSRAFRLLPGEAAWLSTAAAADSADRPAAER